MIQNQTTFTPTSFTQYFNQQDTLDVPPNQNLEIQDISSLVPEEIIESVTPDNFIQTIICIFRKMVYP